MTPKKAIIEGALVLLLFLFSFAGPLDALEGQGCDLVRGTCGQVREEKEKEGPEPVKKSAHPRSPTGNRMPPSIHYMKGPDHAAITIIAYLDILSPASATTGRAIDEIMKSYPEDIRLLFKPYPSPTRPEALLAQEAAFAAGEQGKFWEMQDLLFAHKGEITQKVLMDYAQQLKLKSSQFSLALTTHRFREATLQSVMEAKGFGVTSAPTLFINGRRLIGARSARYLKGIMDEALGLAPPKPALPPGTSSEEIEIDITGSPAQGPEDAPVVILEFSDFQCPFCARVVATMQNILKRYPTQVRWVFKHFPLDFHPDAPLAHAASLAANDQGKFWKMHDLIFSRQQAMKRDHLVAYAQALQLDIERFIKDMESGKYQTQIDRDIQEGRRVGVDGTPTFFINGRRLVGARPIEDFIAIIEEEL